MPVVSHEGAGVGVCVQGEAVPPGPGHLHPLQLGRVSAHRAQRIPYLKMIQVGVTCHPISSASAFQFSPCSLSTDLWAPEPDDEVGSGPGRQGHGAVHLATAVQHPHPLPVFHRDQAVIPTQCTLYVIVVGYDKINASLHWVGEEWLRWPAGFSSHLTK